MYKKKRSRNKLEHYLTLYTKINSKQIKDLNIIPDTTKLLKENTGRTLSDINHSNILFNPSLRVMQMKANKWDLTQKLLHSKANHKQNEKTTHRMGENICK